MMNKISIHATVNSILLVGVIVFGLFYYLNSNKDEITYVDNVKLFNNFNMTKDIKVIEEAKLRKQGKELDSLYAIFQSITNKEDVHYKSVQYQIASKSKTFQEMQDNYVNNLSATVWARLNTYIKEYAEANHLKLVIGADGRGNVMYGNKNIDVTSKILEFSNKKYEGLNN